MSRIPERGRYVSEEPQLVDDGLLGAVLAGVGRRAWALAVDLLLFGLLFGGLFVGLAAWSFHRSDPTFFGSVREVLGEPAVSSERIHEVTLDFFVLTLERCPTAFPTDLEAAIRRRDVAVVGDFLDRHATTIGLGSGRTRLLVGRDETATMILGADLLLGRFSTFVGWATAFLLWFTLWTFWSDGRTPGKMLAGVRVRRLDGRKLSLWDCFGRAGGYSASTATLMLGFLEAIWHPNRQAMHDRIAGTVVLRWRARDPESRRSESGGVAVDA